MSIVIDAENEWVSLKELHTRINKSYRVSIRTLRRWAENGAIPAKRRGREWHVNMADLRYQHSAQLQTPTTETTVHGMAMFIDPNVKDTIETCDNDSCEDPDCTGCVSH